MTKSLIVFTPHPDDELLSIWPYLHYLASGYDVHIVFLTRGEVTAASLRLDGSQVCAWGNHAYTHNPAFEQYAVPTVEEIGLARLRESESAAGAMAMIPPSIAGQPGYVFTHDENLGTAYGCDGCGSSTAPWTETGVAKAQEVMRRYVELYPSSILWTMSPTDAHPDHAAAGEALRRLKGRPVMGADGNITYVDGDPVLAPALVNSRFFVSKLYWSTPLGSPGSRLGEYCGWYPNIYPDNTKTLARINEYTAWIKAKVLSCCTAWNPAQGSFAINGGHSVPSQFANCFGPPPPFIASALWHG